MRSTMEEVERGTDYRNVLIPTDGSKGAQRGTAHALSLAEKYDATVHVLTVVDERSTGRTPALSSDELAFEKAEEEANRLTEAVVAAAEERGLETVRSCRRGVPDETILAYADDHDIDLIVMGVHGDERSARPHIGSTTDRVIREAEVPVLPV